MTRLLSLNADPSTPQVPQPGEVLGGKYRIEREIGSGGMGVVYEVTHLVMTKKRFAVKWLLPLPEGFKQEDVQAALRRFTREAEIAGAICHPNVVQVFDVTMSDSGCFMVMELLEGESLEARLKRAGPLPVAEACRIICASASGVGAAHASGVIHRDIKPANIFLTHTAAAEPSCPKVLDFGISRFTAPEGSDQSTVTRAGTLIGTPMYMAPEQLRSFECDARTDVYGLGVTLYEALSGQPAYTAPTHADLVVRIVTGDVRDLRQLAPSIPAGLCAVVMRALHHQPEKRFASVEQLMAALQPYLSTQAALVALPKRAQRSLALWIALGVGAIGLAIWAARWATSNAADTSPPPTAAAPEPSIVRPKPLQPADPPPPLPAATAEAPQPTAPIQLKQRATRPERPAAAISSSNAQTDKRPSPTTRVTPPQHTPKPRPSLSDGI